MSFSLPLPRVAEAWRALADVHRHMKRSCPGFAPSFPAYARIIGPSEALMAPSYGRKTCMLEVVTAPGTRHAFTFYRALEAAMRAFPDARQHWGKLVLDPRGLSLRWPTRARFAAVRERLDPDRRFMNDFVRAAFLEPR
jgi:L-gulonolactone oxidase